MRIVIVGASSAGGALAETTRVLDSSAEITLVSEEGWPMYSRCLLAKYLNGERARQDLSFRAPGWAEKLNVQVVTHRVTEISAEEKAAKLQSGARLPYDRLGIATGSSAIRPPVPGIRAQGVFDLYTLSIAESMKAWLSGTRRVVILGAGLIGMKAAAALAHLNKQVVLVEQKRTVMPDTLDPRAAALMASRFSKHGVEVRTDETVCEVVTNAERQIRAVRLASGDSIECDMLLCAVGTRANSALIRQAGGQANPGVVVNQFLETSLPDIYAAGDVAQAPMIHSDRVLPAANWYNAKREGRIAAYNMLGTRTEYAGRLRANAVELLGVPLVSVGEVGAGAGEEVTFEDPTCAVYRKLFLRDGRLVGFILVGQVDEAGSLTFLLQTARPINQIRDRLIDGGAGCLPALSVKTWTSSSLTLDASKAAA